MAAYRHIIFDLDHTLWDFHRNSDETIFELCDEYQLPDPEAFLHTYKKINKQLWDAYQARQISKEELRDQRFARCFSHLKLPLEHAGAFSEAYLQRCPAKPHLLPGAQELLHELFPVYTLSILSNGFAEAQYRKLQHAGIASYFSAVFISEELGWHKPDPRIFEHASRSLGTEIEECLMVGDNYETDISGAKQAGMDHVFFNPSRDRHQYPVQHEIHMLSELKAILL